MLRLAQTSTLPLTRRRQRARGLLQFVTVTRAWRRVRCN